MNNLKITFIILTKNEEKNLGRSLESITRLADEIIVVDEFSKDKTLEIAKKFNARIIQNKNSENFAAARNLGMKNAKNDWVFFVDSDEELVGSIGDVGGTESVVGYRIKRRDFLWGQEIKHGENGNWRETRLVKKNTGNWQGKVHEVFKSVSPVANLTGLTLNHYPHQTIREFLSEINKYSDLRAEELFDKKIKSNVFQICAYPLAKFTVDYFFCFGFLDGIRGFIIASMMSFYSFLVRSKLYTLQNKNAK